MPGKYLIAGILSASILLPAAASAADPEPAVAPISLMDTLAVDRILSKQRGVGIQDRVVAVSALFLGMPFKKSPLGGGTGPDPQPLWSFRYVDCMTYVEEVLALAVSLSFDSFITHLTEIRYSDGHTNFESRNHLPEAQWIPNAIRKGYLRDITDEIGGAETATMTLNLATFRSELVVEGHKLPGSVLPEKDPEIRYIPLEGAWRRTRIIPAGAIMNFVREPKPGRPFAITHMGVVVVRVEGGQERRYLRHASRHFGGRVTETPLSSYILSMNAYEAWPALGINVLMPQQPGARAQGVAE